MILRGRGIGADDGSFTIDYGGGDLTGSDLTAAENLNSSLPAGASDSGGSSSSSGSGFNFGNALTSVSSIFGSVSHLFGGSGSSLSPQQLALLQSQQAAARTNTLLIGGGLLLAGGLAFVLLRRRPST